MKIPKLNFKDPKVQAGAAGAGAVVLFALYKHHQNTAAGAAGATGTGSANGTLTDPTAAAAFQAASIENNIVSDLQPRLDQLQKSIGDLKAAPVTPKPTPKPKPSPAPGPGKTRTILPVLNSHDFLGSFAGSSKDLLALGSIDKNGKYVGRNVSGGAPVYYEAPGSNVAKQGGSRAPGTKLFTLQSLKGYVKP